MESSLITLINCAIGYEDQRYLSDVSLSFEEDKRFAIIGPNASGKSSLLKTIAGLEKPLEGIINRRKNLKVAMMFQDYREILLPWATVRKNIEIIIQLVDSAHSQHSKTEELVENLGLSKTYSQKVYKLSGGQQQRAALAQILCSNPELLLLDEPLSAIDYSERPAILEWLMNYLSSEKISALMVTHDTNEALAFTSELLLEINGGRIHRRTHTKVES